MLAKQSAIAICICFTFSATAIAQTTDSIFTQNKVNGVWQKGTIDIIKRDNSCYVLSDHQLSWDASNNKWVNSYFTVYQYPEGKTIGISQSWDALNNTWINSSKSLYYTQGSQKIYQLQVWDAGSQAWINNYRSLEDLDDEGRTVIGEFDLYMDNEWQKIQRSLIAYDESDRVAESIFQMWMNNTWSNNNKTTNNYATGKSFNYLWDAGNMQWTIFQRTLNDYLGNTANQEKSLTQFYSGYAWQNAQRFEAAYNSNNQMLSSFSQFWDAGAQIWINASTVKTDYYSDGNLNHFEFKAWDASSNSWAIGFRSTFTKINCSQGLHFIPVTQITNNTGIAIENGKPILFQQLAGAKTNTANTIKRMLNPFASGSGKLVFDVVVTNSQLQQQAFQMILSSAPDYQNANSQTKNDATAKNKNGFIFSPNPAKNYFDINLSAYKNTGNITLKLSDISGKLVLQQKMNTGTQRIYLPALQKGMYIVTITSGKETSNQKLVIE